MIFTTIVNKLGGYYALRQVVKKHKSGLKKKAYKFLIKALEHETGAFLPTYNLIKGPINFIHGTYGIFISGGAIIGKNCTIYQQVTIGSNMLVDSKGLGSPVIGDNCLIGAGAKLVGNIVIGNNVRIGANAVVSFNVPDNCVVVAQRATIIQKEDLNNKIYQLGKTGWGYYQDGQFIYENDQEIQDRLYGINEHKTFQNNKVNG